MSKSIGGCCELDILQRPEKYQFYPLGAPTRRKHFESNQTVFLTSFTLSNVSLSGKIIIDKIFSGWFLQRVYWMYLKIPIPLFRPRCILQNKFREIHDRC